MFGGNTKWNSKHENYVLNWYILAAASRRIFTVRRHRVILTILVMAKVDSNVRQSTRNENNRFVADAWHTCHTLEWTLSIVNKLLSLATGSERGCHCVWYSATNFRAVGIGAGRCSSRNHRYFFFFWMIFSHCIVKQNPMDDIDRWGLLKGNIFLPWKIIWIVTKLIISFHDSLTLICKSG